VKVGEIYEVKHKWLLPAGSSDFWSNCGPVLYLGEDIIDRTDGIKIINHVVFVDGETRILDKTFLKFLEVING